MSPTREKAALAFVALLMAGLAVAGCGNSSASPTAQPTAQPTAAATVNAVVTAEATPTDAPTEAPTETPTSIVTAAPTRTKDGGSGATPAPPPLPNLMGLVPELKPITPTCNVNFVIDFQVGNKGLGDATSATTVRIVDQPAAGGVQHVLGTMNIPALPHSSGGHYFATVKVQSYGNRMLILTIDPTNLVPESNEGDNVVTKAYFVSIGSCPKL
jgi:hypothetical protein